MKNNRILISLINLAAISLIILTFGSRRSFTQDHYLDSDEVKVINDEEPLSKLAHETKGGKTMDLNIPQPLKLEHEELDAELVKATKESGEVGEAARMVAKILHFHFVKEEEYALPPLALLPLLAEGKVTPDMEKVIAITDRLKSELPEMLEEHKKVVTALDNLAVAAKKENKMEYVHFTEKLISHARTEEEILYPATILIGEYLKLKLNK